jgi:CRP-like cAMP-binding protein
MVAQTDLSLNMEDIQSFSAGQAIFNAGDQGTVMYVVVDGKIDIVVNGNVIDSVGPGGILGEMALIDTRPRSASAVAQTDCQIVPINEQRFKFLIQETPAFAIQVMKVLVNRLRLMDEQV